MVGPNNADYVYYLTVDNSLEVATELSRHEVPTSYG